MLEKERIEMQEDEIDLFDLLQKILNKWKIIATITLIFTITAAGISFVLPNQYMAQATYEIYTYQNQNEIYTYQNQNITSSQNQNQIQNQIIVPSILKNLGTELKNVDIEINKDNPKYVVIKAYGETKDIAQERLKNLVNQQIPAKFQDLILDTKLKFEKRIESIDKTLNLYKESKNVILEPSQVSNLINEKEQILMWLNNPYILKQISDIEVSTKPVKPKRLLIITVAFISGFFFSIFVALFIDAYNNWKLSRKVNISGEGK